MKDLLTSYSIEQILLFLFLIAMAIKEGISLVNWFIDYFKKIFKKEEKGENLEDKVSTLYDMQIQQEEKMNKMCDNINILMESDRDSIKSWIVEKHHHFCYEIKAIDYFSLESIERRYQHYKAEDGNSYVATLMEELEALPKIETSEIANTRIKYDNSKKK